LFVPDRPATNAPIEAVREAEMNLEIDTLVEQALQGVERVTIAPSLSSRAGF
jgi:hypothetical protein